MPRSNRWSSCSPNLQCLKIQIGSFSDMVRKLRAPQRVASNKQVLLLKYFESAWHIQLLWGIENWIPCDKPRNHCKCYGVRLRHKIPSFGCLLQPPLGKHYHRGVNTYWFIYMFPMCVLVMSRPWRHKTSSAAWHVVFILLTINLCLSVNSTCLWNCS